MSVEKDLNVYDNELGIANGDPVIVHTGRTAVTLGTGFHGYDDVAGQVSYAIDTGRSTNNIPPEAAKELHKHADGRVDIFSVGASLQLHP